MLARDARTGLVIRRGPSKRVATIHWNRTTDEFQVGQWLKGRIFERRSDLSPDGKYWIYFAMNGKWHHEARGSWTAIARTPYLKALALYPQGDCWNGGGLWTGDKTYWINGGDFLQETTEVYRDHCSTPPEKLGAECLSIYQARLLRDGWQLTERIAQSTGNRIDVFDKQIDGHWRLKKLAHAQTDSPQGKGCYWDEHAILNAASGIIANKPEWEWADIDEGRLVWAADGRLFSGELGRRGIVNESELYNFNELSFRLIKAPY